MKQFHGYKYKKHEANHFKLLLDRQNNNTLKNILDSRKIPV